MPSSSTPEESDDSNSASGFKGADDEFPDPAHHTHIERMKQKMAERKADLKSSAVECKNTVDEKLSECYNTICPPWPGKSEDKRLTGNNSKVNSDSTGKTLDTALENMEDIEAPTASQGGGAVFGGADNLSLCSKSNTRTPSMNSMKCQDQIMNITDSCADELQRFLKKCCY